GGALINRRAVALDNNSMIADLARRLQLIPEGDHDHDTPGGRATEDARLLVVDDDPSLAISITRILERDGFRSVERVGDGRRALARLIERPPDVMVLDIHMPHMDGFAVLREMLNGEQRVGTIMAVIAVSGDHSPSARRSIFTSGADDFLARPFD